MPASLSKNWFKLVTVVILAAIIGAVFYSSKSKGDALPVVKQAPAFAMTNVLSGKETQLADSAGTVRLMEFIYTNCPDVCPATTYNMVLLQNELKQKGLFGKNVTFLAVTYDPDRDTPEVLQKYGERLGIDRSGWQLLRGQEAQTKKIANDYGIIVEKLKDGTFMHSNLSLVLIDGKNNIRRIYEMGNEMDNDKILADIVKLTKES